MTARELNPEREAEPETKAAEGKRGSRTKTRAALADRAGAIDSEGDRAHNADTARQDIGVTGVGVKICALSDGVDSLADLPGAPASCPPWTSCATQGGR